MRDGEIVFGSVLDSDLSLSCHILSQFVRLFLRFQRERECISDLRDVKGRGLCVHNLMSLGHGRGHFIETT